MEFIETSIFTKLIYTYLSDDEYVALQSHLLKLRQIAEEIKNV